MKKTIVKVVVTAMLLSFLLNLFTGCANDNTADGPGMVNFPGLLLEVLIGEWEDTTDGSYHIIFNEDNTMTLSYKSVPLLENAALTLYIADTAVNDYHEIGVSPNVFTDSGGNSVEITKGGHENGTVTMEFTLSDGTKSTLTFVRYYELLDGPDMYYSGGYLDDAITGCWYSADGRIVLDLDGLFADFTVDGEQLFSKDNSSFLEHNFSEGDDLNERCELYPTESYMDGYDPPPIIINEMWYQAEHIYMNATWDGKTEEIVLSKLDDAMPEGE